MVFFGLSHSTKTIIIKTLEQAFKLHPVHKDVVVRDKFADELQHYPAIVVKNVSDSTTRLGSDDFVQDIVTEEGIVIIVDSKGTSIKSVKKIDDRILYCVKKAEIFKINILSNNQISLMRRTPRQLSDPLPIQPGSKVTDLISDVEIEFGDNLVAGDYVLMMLLPLGATYARRYGGLFEMEMSLTVIARSTSVAEDVSDWALFNLWHVKKLELEKDFNILLKEIKQSGEAEFPEVKDPVFTSTIDISLRTQWQNDVPIHLYMSELKFILEDMNNEICDQKTLSILD